MSGWPWCWQALSLVFGLTVVKVQQGDMMEAFDHQPRVSVLPPDPAEDAR